MGKLGTTVFKSAIAAFALWPHLLVAQVGLRIDGQTQNPIAIRIDEPAIVEISGPPSARVALYVGLEAIRRPTPYGLLGVDPFIPSSFFIFNGFVDGAIGSRLGSADGRLSFADRPFAGSAALGLRFWTQAFVEDPSHIAGYRFTETLEAYAVPAAPQIRRLTNTTINRGGALLIEGKHFFADPTLNQVTIGGAPCGVVAATPSQLTAIIPNDAISGAVEVITPAGRAGGSPHVVTTWATVIENLTAIPFGTSPVFLSERNAVIGSLPVATIGLPAPPLLPTPRPTDRYDLVVPAGREIFAEVYSYDRITGRVTGASNTLNMNFDPLVRITRGSELLVEDHDSGPELAGAIGTPGGPSWFIADQTATYTIEVDTRSQLSGGDYLLSFGHREPIAAMPLSIQTLSPNLARTGDLVVLLGTGISPRFGLSEYEVRVDGRVAAIRSLEEGRIVFEVPVLARSGVVELRRGAASSGIDQNRMASWLMHLEGSLHIESQVRSHTISAPISVIGTIDRMATTDAYTFSAIAGRHYRIEANAYDAQAHRIMTSTFLANAPVDPELEVHNEGPLTRALITDGGGGPGANALIGSSFTGTFSPTRSGNYVILVRSLFGWSFGDYILSVVEVP